MWRIGGANARRFGTSGEWAYSGRCCVYFGFGTHPHGPLPHAEHSPTVRGQVRGDDQFNRLLHAWFAQMARVLLPGHAFYIWGGYAKLGNYPPVLKAVGLCPS